MIKPKRKPIPPMQRTYCEEEEKRYQSRPNIGMPKMAYWALFAFVACVCGFGIIEASKPMPIECEWNGAGDNWTCNSCGCSNNSFEMICWNCGKWR